VHPLPAALTSPQHSSFAATSECSALAVRAYFQNGTLPRPGTVCAIESVLFGNGATSGVARRDRDLASALATLKETVKIPRYGRFGV
jgi:hypothetical protein